MHTLSEKQALLKLNSDKKGLSESGVVLSIKKNGLNIIKKPKQKSVFKRIIEISLEPMMLILVFALVVTFGVNLGKLLKTGDGNFVECLGILIAISISVALTVIMEGKSKKAFDLLNGISNSVSVRVRRNGEIRIIPKNEIVVGDIVLVEAGDKIEADGRLISANSLKVDEAILTGESKPSIKQADVILNEKTILAERRNMLFSGTYVTEGDGEMVVSSIGKNAEIGKIASELNNNLSLSAPLQEKLYRMGKLVSIIGAAASLGVFIMSLVRLILLGEANFFSVQNIAVEAIILLVAAVPEGLPATVAISLSLNVLRLAKSNALIKKLVATETLGCISVICSDKTGTLTKNEMSVEKVVFANENNKNSQSYIELNVAINSTTEVINNTVKGSKTEAALINYLSSLGQNYKTLRNSYEIINVKPFSSKSKKMETTIKYNGQNLTLIKGSPEAVIENCLLTESDKAEIIKEISYYQRDARRIIAFSHIINGITHFDGYMSLVDEIRPDAFEAVETCKKAGIKVMVLTGDNLSTAQAVALRLKISGNAISAQELESLNDADFSKTINELSVIARCTPNLKLRVVKALQQLNYVVAVTGDGVNDATAIKNSDVGIAMGDGSDITKEAADVILLDNSFSTIVKAISFGRNVFSNFRRFISFQLAVNLSSMTIIIAFLIAGRKSPFSSGCLLWLNVIMDGPLALSLGLEKSKNTFLERKPTSRNENILSARLLIRVALNSFYIALIVILQDSLNFLQMDYCDVATSVFCLFVVSQLFNAFNSREVGRKSAFCNIFGNKLLLIMLVITFLLQILITETMPSFFGTQSLSALAWVKITLTASSVVLFSEGCKLIYNLFTVKRSIKGEKYNFDK